MREIRFRGRNINTGDWVFGYFKKNRHGDCYIEDEDGLATAVDPETVSQMVEEGIYEGDYIDDGDDIWLIEYDDVEHAFCFVGYGVSMHSEFLDGRIVSVLGNKWENSPEDFYGDEEDEDESR